jgi:hypothetical protein
MVRARPSEHDADNEHGDSGIKEHVADRQDHAEGFGHWDHVSEHTKNVFRGLKVMFPDRLGARKGGRRAQASYGGSADGHASVGSHDQQVE